MPRRMDPGCAPETAPGRGDAWGGFDQIEHAAQCRSIDDLSVELRNNPFIRYISRMTPEEDARESAAAEAHQKAEALYGDDPERILAAIEAGTHPLQRYRLC
jgi:hypothetical protein